jgi:hypothetical protein
VNADGKNENRGVLSPHTFFSRIKSMNTHFCIGLALSGLLMAASSVASPQESPVPPASKRATPGKVEFSIGPRGAAAQRSVSADMVRQFPAPLRFIAAYLPAQPVPTPGLDAITRARETRERASSLADVSRVYPPEPFSVRAPEVLVGASAAGAAVALHPTVVDSEHGAKIQVNPMIWPPGISIQGVFF